jgi:hypothetical protein
MDAQKPFKEAKRPSILNIIRYNNKNSHTTFSALSGYYQTHVANSLLFRLIEYFSVMSFIEKGDQVMAPAVKDFPLKHALVHK